MIPFDFQLRTRVIFGPGTLGRLGALARDLGFTRTLLVADPGLRDAGYVAAAVRNLEAAGIAVVAFHDFGQNPDSAMVEAGRAFAAPLGIDSMWASAAAARSIAPRASTSCSPTAARWRDYRGYGKASTPLLPMIGVPTTAGTGSEAQSYAVISDAATHMKMACGDPSAAARSPFSIRS